MNKKWFNKTINFTTKLTFIFTIYNILFLLVYILSPSDMFEYSQSYLGHHFKYEYLGGIYNQISIDTSILVGHATIPNVKIGLIIVWLLKLIPLSLIASFFMYTIRSISNTYLVDMSFFDPIHAKLLKQNALIILITSLSLNFILCLTMNLYTHTMSFNLIELISFPGVLFAGILELIAKVFEHGIMLQNEYDLTL